MLEKIRNFSIISHIDHGKSTLADRFLEITKAVAGKDMHEQYLDSMSLEKEKGITIKMHPVRMFYGDCLLNLIDTPGHVDFSYEISRALACVEGAVLLVDASKGIQAQTLFNLEEAKKQNLKIIGAVNKIDLPQAEVSRTRKELASVLNQEESEILLLSAKTGQGAEELLKAVIEKIPSPRAGGELAQSLVFDSQYDPFFGVTAFLRVFQGEFKKGDKVYLIKQNCSAEAKEIGVFTPQMKSTGKLKEGEIGYLKTGIKEPGKVKVGDTLVDYSRRADSLPGYKEPQPMLYITIYPRDSRDFADLEKTLEKLKLNDPSLEFQLESKNILGQGFKIGFLGSLQAEIILRRIREEFGLEIISTSPQVIFKVILEGKEKEISSPEKWPDPARIKEAQEPWVEIEIIAPNSYFNSVFKVLQNFQFDLISSHNLSSTKSLLKVEAPLREIISGKFYDAIKSSTQGYASFNFKQIGFKKEDLIKVDFLIAGEKENCFSRIAPRRKAFSEAKKFLRKLKEVIPSQQFSLALQAAVGGKIIARETKKALRKDVTASLYGGDVTRKRKLLEIQKKGKKKMKEKAKVNLPSEVYFKLLKY